MSPEEQKAKFQPAKRRTIVAKPQVASARISPDGRWLAGGGFDGVVRVWDLHWQPLEPPIEDLTAKAKNNKPEPPAAPEPNRLSGHHGWVEGLAMHGERLLTGDSWGALRAWTLDQENRLLWAHEQAHDGWLRQIAVSADGQTLATCGRDQTVNKWSADTGKLLRAWNTDQDVYSVVFHPDGRLFSGDSRGNIHRWSDDSDEPATTLDATTLYKYDRIQDVGGVKSLAIDADSGTLVAAGATPSRGATVQGEPTLLFLDLESGQLRKTVKLGATNQCYVHDVQRHPAGFWMAVTCGTPGTGQVLFLSDDADEPFFRETKIPNCHSLSYHAGSGLLAVASTNRGSNGNGRRLNKEGEYEMNSTPVEIFDLAAG